MELIPTQSGLVRIIKTARKHCFMYQQGKKSLIFLLLFLKRGNFKIFILFLIMLVCMHMNMNICVQVPSKVGGKRPQISLGLQLHVVVSLLMWVLVTELRSSIRAVHALNH